MARRAGRRWEQGALVLAIVVAGACVYLLAQDAGRGGDVATGGTTVPVVRQTTTTATTAPLPPACDAFQDVRARQEASLRVQDLLVQVYFSPGDEVAVQAAIDALDVYVADDLPAIASALDEVASDLPDRRAGALLVRGFYLSVIRALEATSDREAIVAEIARIYTREDAEAAFTAIAGFIEYDLATCPQPAR